MMRAQNSIKSLCDANAVCLDLDQIRSTRMVGPTGSQSAWRTDGWCVRENGSISSGESERGSAYPELETVGARSTFCLTTTDLPFIGNSIHP